MEDITTPHAAAVAAVEQAEASGSASAAIIVFDALDQLRDVLTPMDRYDFALSTWNRFLDNELPFTDEQVVTVAVRAAGHLPEHAVVDLIDARLGDTEKRIRLGDGRGLAWFPADRIVILSWPIGAGIADIVLGDTRTRA